MAVGMFSKRQEKMDCEGEVSEVDMAGTSAHFDFSSQRVTSISWEDKGNITNTSWEEKLGDLPSSQVSLYCPYFEREEEHTKFPSASSTEVKSLSSEL